MSGKPEAPDNDWDDLLGEVKQSGISPEMARALLSMNPKLREEGKNTAWVVASGQKAAHQGAQLQAQPATKAAKSGGDVFSELDVLRRNLEAEEQQIDLQTKQLQEQKIKAKRTALEAFMKVLLAKDPEMLSPMTQQAVADNKVFLDRLGFSVKGFVEMKRKMGTK